MAPRRFYERPAGARRVYRARVAAGGMCTRGLRVSGAGLRTVMTPGDHPEVLTSAIKVR
jgi:hypothetical protein